jgi:uncharacterized zinc-type alcohol dehydrogenase-like protein
MKIKAMAATAAKGPLAVTEIDLGAMRDDQVEVAVKYCGVCHSDLSMLNNDWGMSQYPFVPGHEIVGAVTAVGGHVKHLKVGQMVGVGWFSGSCNTCGHCVGGDHNLCRSAEGVIVGRPGGFATHVRANATWAVPLPAGLDVASAGPLFCGGITVFNPIVQFGVLPTHKVGVVGIGGLGHLALQFLNKWGCEVTAFTSSESKAAEARKLGAHKTVTSTDDKAVAAIAGTLDFILVTVNVTLNWGAYFGALAPKGRLHVVGAVGEPIPAVAFQLLSSQLSLSGSPLGSPATTAKMLEFCGRHGIRPVTEMFKLSDANKAMAHLHSGKARYRIVLENDLG